MDANNIINSNVGSVSSAPTPNCAAWHELSNDLTIWASESDLHNVSECDIASAIIHHDTLGSA